MAITTIMAAVDMPHGTAAGRAGLFRAASVSRIAMVHGTTHLIIGTGTDNQLKAASTGGLLFHNGLDRGSGEIIYYN